MVGAGAVVAQGLGGVAAHEDGPGVAHLGQPPLGVGHRELQVLGGDAVDQRHRLLPAGALDQGPATGQGLAHDLVALQGRQQAIDGGLHGIEVLGIPAHQDRLGILIVLRLGEEVHGQPLRVGAAVGDHQDLRGAGDHVDPHLAEHRPLGGGHVDVAGPDDLVDPGHRLGAIGQGRHRLGAAHGEHPVHPGQVGRGQHQLVEHAVRGRHHHDDLAHPGHVGGNGVHQHRGGVGRLAPRNVDAGAIQGGDLLTQHGAVGLGVVPGLRPLALVVEADPLGGLGQRLALLGGQAVIGLAQPRRGQGQLGHARHGKAVEAVAGLDQGGVTAGTHRGEDLLDPRLDRGVGNAVPGQQGGEARLEVGIAGGKPGNAGGNGGVGHVGIHYGNP